ncbi:MAG: CoA-binding protein [Endomicrobia bacterium]|nr:CoA-binding protein [Endomicrobiia bacterium]
MQDLIKEILSKKNFAVVGSFRNEQKVAYRIFRHLKSKGYNVYAVSKTTSRVDEDICYRTILDLPQNIEVVDIVTPPEVSLEIVKQCVSKGVKYVWLQPGAESNEVIEFCRNNDINVVYGTCIMMY